jgi:hypothetical protein
MTIDPATSPETFPTPDPDGPISPGPTQPDPGQTPGDPGPDTDPDRDEPRPTPGDPLTQDEDGG